MSKPSAKDLLNELKSGISSGWDQNDLKNKKAYSLYELYVFKIVLEGIKNMSVKHGYKPQITYKDSNGKKISPARFQTGPHNLNAYGYMHAEIRFGGSHKRAIEVHCGVQYEGKSGVVHECDISILGTTEANKRRSDGKPPKYKKLLLSIECKFYVKTIELSMMRGFRGLIDDIGSRSNAQIFVTSTDIRPTGKTLIKYKRQSSLDQLVPANKTKVYSLKKMAFFRIVRFLI